MSDKTLQTPYGVFDFTRFRNEGYYYVDKKSERLPLTRDYNTTMTA